MNQTYRYTVYNGKRYLKGIWFSTLPGDGEYTSRGGGVIFGHLEKFNDLRV